jgi:hypothetical protein
MHSAFDCSAAINTQQSCDNIYPDLIAKAHVKLTEFTESHPSLHLSRKQTTDIQRQNINIEKEYGD